MKYYAYEESSRFDHPASWDEPVARKNLLGFLQENWEQRDSLFDDGNRASNQQFLTVSSNGHLRTNNYIGTISFNGDVLNIFPKVFNVNSEEPKIDDLINNLVQWLDYCNKFDPRYVSIKSDITGDTNLKELFITLFVRKLESVFERSPYFTYEDQEEDLTVIRGKFDVLDYITRKMTSGQMNRFHCEYSSFEFDNLLNRIIKRVCLNIVRDGTRPINEKRIRTILAKLNDVEEVKCTARDCSKVKLNKMQRGYADILSMCKMFLLNQEPTYSVNTDDAFCFLFPTELLFQGFIGGFLREMLSPKGGTVELQTRDYSLIDDIVYAGRSYGSAFSLRPDILCTIEDNLFLMDTKYKRIRRFDKVIENEDLWKSGLIEGVKQDDLYQVSIYALKHQLNKAYLIYPLNRLEELEPNMPVLQELIMTGTNLEDIKRVEVFLMRVPFVFEKDIESTKTNLRKALLKAFE